MNNRLLTVSGLVNRARTFLLALAGHDYAAAGLSFAESEGDRVLAHDYIYFFLNFLKILRIPDALISVPEVVREDDVLSRVVETRVVRLFSIIGTAGFLGPPATVDT